MIGLALGDRQRRMRTSHGLEKSSERIARMGVCVFGARSRLKRPRAKGPEGAFIRCCEKRCNK
eukprot:11180852-Lingulodinium_polyedra.AAC.1